MPHTDDAIETGEFQGPFRVRYRQWVEDIKADIANTDLAPRENFHHALHMLARLGLNQVEFAREHGFQASTVNRWVNGQKAPPKLRRAPIVREGLKLLLDRIDENSDVSTHADTDFLELRSIPEDDAPPVRRVAAQRR